MRLPSAVMVEDPDGPSSECHVANNDPVFAVIEPSVCRTAI